MRPKRVTKACLKELGIINSWDLAIAGPEPRVYLAYTPKAAHFGGCWRVYRPGYNTDPDAAWYDNGNKTFIGSICSNEALVNAMEWAGDRYGIPQWERSPFGSWHPLGTMQSAISAKARTRKENNQ